MVTDVDNDGLIIKEKDGHNCAASSTQCKVWSAGVGRRGLSASKLAEQSGGQETDRAGRVMVEPGLSLPRVIPTCLLSAT